MSDVLSFVLLAIQIACLVYFLWMAIKLIDENHKLRLADCLRSMHIDLLQGTERYLGAKIAEQAKELKKERLHADELRQRVKILEGKLQYNMKQEEPRYERTNEDLV